MTRQRRCEKRWEKMKFMNGWSEVFRRMDHVVGGQNDIWTFGGIGLILNRITR